MTQGYLFSGPLLDGQSITNTKAEPGTCADTSGLPELESRASSEVALYDFTDWTDQRLIAEYHEMAKASFAMFSGNAKRRGNEVVNELARRGLTEIHDIFGTMPIRRF